MSRQRDRGTDAEGLLLRQTSRHPERGITPLNALQRDELQVFKLISSKEYGFKR